MENKEPVLGEYQKTQMTIEERLRELEIEIKELKQKVAYEYILQDVRFSNALNQVMRKMID